MLQKLRKNRTFPILLISDILSRVFLVPARVATEDAVAAGLGAGVAVHPLAT